MGSLFGGGKHEFRENGSKGEPNKGMTTANDYGYGAQSFRGNDFVLSPGLASMQASSQVGPMSAYQGAQDQGILSAYGGSNPRGGGDNPLLSMFREILAKRYAPQTPSPNEASNAPASSGPPPAQGQQPPQTDGLEAYPYKIWS